MEAHNMPSHDSHSQVTSYGSSISHSYGESISESQGWSEGSFLIESGWTGTSRQYDRPPTYKQYLDNLRRKDSLRGAETTEISVRLGNYSASHFEGSAYTSNRVIKARRQLRKAFDDLLDALIASGDLVTWPARTWSRDDRRRLLLTLLLSEWA
jgi:hypothetical protein